MRWIVCLFAASAFLAPVDAALTERFLNRDDPQPTSYVAWRRLEARNERFKLEGWIEACVFLSDRSQFTYDVRREGGSAYIRNKVLRKALEAERDLVATADPTRASKAEAPGHTARPRPGNHLQSRSRSPAR